MKTRLLLAAAVAAPLAFVASGARTTDDVLRLLPEDAGSAEAIRVARAFGTADVLLFDVDGRPDPDRLPEVVAALVADLRALSEIDRVDAGLTFEEAAGVGVVASAHAAALVPVEALRERTSEEGVRAAFGAWLGDLAGPAGSLAAARLPSDPLRLDLLARDALGVGVPGDFARGVGVLRSRDGEHALVVATSRKSPTDVAPGDPFVRSIADVAARQGLPVTWTGGIRVAAATADGVRADVRRTVFVGMLALAAVVAVGLRRVMPVLGAAGPLAFATLATAAATALVSPVHGLQLAFVGALAGIAVDYWIHLYLVASSEHAADPGSGRIAAARRALGFLRGPLSLSAGATALAFAALLASGMPLVRDFGVLGLGATLGAVGGVFLVGPAAFALVGPGPVPTEASPSRPLLAAVVAVVIVALASFAPAGSIDPDPQALLSKPAEIRALEAHFHDTWDLGAPRGLAVVEGPDDGSVRDRARRVEEAFGDLGFVQGLGPGAVVPGPATRAERAAALPPEDVLQERIDRIAGEMGFSALPGAAARIVASAQADLARDAWVGTALANRVDRHLVATAHGFAALVTVPLVDPDAEPLLGDAVHAADPEARWVVPTDLAGRGIGEALAAFGRATPWAAALVVGFLALRMRRSSDVLRALAPLAAALTGAGGAMTLAGMPWNVVSLAGVVLLIGLSVDYGVFVVEARTGRESAVVRRAIGLSAATTLAGFGGLALAESPALAGLGVAVCAGLACAAATALVVLPALDGPPVGAMGALRRWGPRVAWAVVVGVHLDLLWTLSATLRPPEHPVARAPAVAVVGPEKRAGTARLRFTEGVRVLYTEGEPYTAGLAYGALTADLRQRVERELFDTFADRVPSPVARWLITRGSLVFGRPLYAAIRPADRMHLAGVVAAAPDPWSFKGDPFTRRVYYHALHDLGQALVDTPLLAACTGFVATGTATVDGHALLARNFDFEGGVTFDRDKIVWVHRPTGGHAFLAIGFAGMLGAVSGVNDQGLAVAINAAGSDDAIRAGTPMTLIVREILETAGSIDEAHAVLRTRTGFVSENVLVVDGDARQAAVFEVTPGRVVRVDVPAWRAVANHFTSPGLADDPVNRERMDEITTVPRLARMEELIEGAGPLDPAIASRILRDRLGVGGASLPAGHRHAIDADVATHSVVIDATERTVWVSRFPNVAAGYVVVDLDDVLAGDLDAREVVAARPDAAHALVVAAARDRLRKARRLSDRDALPLVLEALHDLPDHPEALYETGRILWALGRRDEARPLLEAARSAPPEYRWQEEAIDALLEER